MNYDEWEHLIPDALRELIIEALKNRDDVFIRGIECFSEISSWDDIRGIAIIISLLFEKMIKAKKEDALKIEKRINDEYSDLVRLGILENLEKNKDMYKEMWVKKEIFIEDAILSEVHSGKKYSDAQRVVLSRIHALKDYGFIEEDKSGEYIRLSNIWKGYIDDIQNKNMKQQTAYIYALGKMIGHALVGQVRYGADNEKIIKPLKVMRNILHIASQNSEGKVKEGDIEDYFISMHVKLNRWIEFKEKDKMKAPDIRAISDERDGYIYFNREMILANERINQRVNILWQQRQRGNE